MKKTLSKYIIGGVFFVLALVLCFTMGLVAGNDKKDIEFNVGVQYEANMDVAVKVGNEFIFNSQHPNDINKMYINSIVGNTVNVYSDKFGDTINLTLLNYSNEQYISIYFNGFETPATTIAPAADANTPAIYAYSTAKSDLGATIINIRFEVAILKTFATLTQNADNKTYTFTVDASISGEPADSSLYTKVYTELDKANFTSQYVSSINSAPWRRDGNWSSITKVVFTENVSNPDLNISCWFCGDADDGEAYPITSVTFHENIKLKTIGSHAFADCTSLTSIKIPSSVITIDDDAFYFCKTLASVEFSENSQLTTIDNYAFARCYKLDNVNIPASVATVGSHAFSTCDSLTSVIIPSSVTTIGYYAFYSCNSLTSVTFEDTSTWYWTSTENHNFTGGTAITYDLSDKGIAATCLKSTYAGRYWYKL